MEDMDERTEETSLNRDEDDLLMEHVVQDDHELMYLDVCLNEICRQQHKQQENGA